MFNFAKDQTITSMKDILTPCILQTIIICCTIVILANIGVSAYRIKKAQERKWTSYIFIASVLLIVAISIFSVFFYGDKNVLDFISLASALISIILAIITIIYSFVINSQTAGEFNKLNEASTVLQNAAKKVENATISYKDSADSLEENIKKIIEVINNVESKTDKILDGLKNQRTTNYRFAKTPFDSSSSEQDSIDKQTFIDNFVVASSPVGIMVMYACMKAAKSDKKTFNLKDFFDEGNLLAYCGGFLIATTSAGFIQSTIDFTTNNVNVLSCSEMVDEPIDRWLQNADFNNIQGLAELKDKIDIYFDRASTASK